VTGGRVGNRADLAAGGRIRWCVGDAALRDRVGPTGFVAALCRISVRRIDAEFLRGVNDGTLALELVAETAAPECTY
jgi:hypothetical protein